MYVCVISEPAGREGADVGDDGRGRLHSQVHARHVAQPAAVGDDHQAATQPDRDRRAGVPRHRSQEDVLPAGLHGGAALVSVEATRQSGDTGRGEPQRHDLQMDLDRSCCYYYV